MNSEMNTCVTYKLLLGVLNKEDVTWLRRGRLTLAWLAPRKERNKAEKMS
jgi:hypothetical protein